VGCVPEHGGVMFSSLDPTSMENQILPMVSFLKSTIAGWTGLNWF
jgi:hypothetical protein